METSPRYYELLEAMPKLGCPICRLILHNRDRYMNAMLYEYVNKGDTHAAFRAARGLCNDHLSRLQSMPGNALGVSLLMHGVLHEVLTVTPAAKSGGLGRLFKRAGGEDTAEALEPVGPCIICKNMDAVEESYLDVLKIYYGDKLLDGLRESPGGLCLPHYRMALRRLPDATQLVQIQQAHWERLHAQVGDFIDRINLVAGNIHDLSTHESDDSWRRAIRYMVGEPEVFGLRRNTDT